jgi:Zn-dependent protease
MDELLLGVIWYAVLIFSLTFHEAAHALAAKRGGDPTAYLGGQVSLDPTPHIRREKLGTVVVPILSYAMAGWMIGWASTPYDRRWAECYPRRAAWMSLAGPGANFALVLAAAAVIRIGVFADVFYAPDTLRFAQVVAAHGDGVWTALATLVSVAFTLNLLLLVFNLIPVPPLDGSGAVTLVLGEGAARRFQALLLRPQFALIGLVLAWLVIGELFAPIHLAAVNLLYPEFSYG